MKTKFAILALLVVSLSSCTVTVTPADVLSAAEYVHNKVYETK